MLKNCLLFLLVNCIISLSWILNTSTMKYKYDEIQSVENKIITIKQMVKHNKTLINE